ncbi:MAG: ArsC/Spx/MgsR family protein [Planctomycetota bacterium]
MADPIQVLFNPRCSKCRQARDLLEERGVEFELRHYLDNPLSKDEISGVLTKLGAEDASPLLRAKEPAFQELGLAQADASARLDALAQHPSLMERPVVIRGDRAVVARPPELLLDLL